MDSGTSDQFPMDIHVDEKMSNNPRYAWQKLSVKQKIDLVALPKPSSPIPDHCIRFVCVSDTHNTVENQPDLIPPGDVLLHAGDFTMVGLPAQVDKFNTFLGTLPHKAKVVIAGNHDMTLDDNSVHHNRQYLHSRFGISQSNFEDYIRDRNVKSSKQLLTNCVLLEDSRVEICGVKIYGAPWVPEFCFMGFNVPRGQPLLNKWNLIPSDTDILMTHGPPLGRGDLCFSGERAGCLELLNTIQKRVKPKYHIFGHIHEGYGVTTDGTTTFINPSMCTLRYRPEQPALIFDFPLPEGHTRKELSSLDIVSSSHAPCSMDTT